MLIKKAIENLVGVLQQPACLVNQRGRIYSANASFASYFTAYLDNEFHSLVKPYKINHKDKTIITKHLYKDLYEITLLWDAIELNYDRTTLYIGRYKHSVESNIHFYENIIDRMPGHVYWKDMNGVVKGCNLNLMKAANFSTKSEVIGTTAYDVLSRELADNVAYSDKIVLTTGKDYVSEEPFKTELGNQTIFLSNKTPLRNEEKQIIGILGVSVDITAQKQLDEKEKEVLKKQVELSEMIGATVAHEVRTPLGAVQIAASVIEDALEIGNLQQVEKSCQEIRGHLKRANAFIESFLLNVKRAHPVSTEEIGSIKATVVAALENYAYPTLTDRALVTMDPSFVDFEYGANSSLVEHVLSNLLKNALYFIKKSGKGEIYIWSSREKNFNCLHFKDSGLGISTEVLPHIFDKFYTSTDVGSGVGLSFCKMTMESIGGRIDCDSKFGEFTEFKLYFPIVEQK